MHAITHTHPYTHTLQIIETTGQLPTPPACSTPSAESRGSSPEQRSSTERQLHRLRTHGLHPVSQDALNRRYTPPVERRAHQYMAEQTSVRCMRCTPAPSTPPPAPARAASTMVEAPHHAARGTPMPVTFLVSHEPGPSTNPIGCIETEEWLSFIAVKSTVVLLRVRRKWQYEIRRGLCSGGFDART